MVKIEQSINGFNPNAKLRLEMRVSSAGQHLYSIGLTPYRNRCDAKSRPALSHPFIAFIFIAIVIIRQTVCLLIQPENELEKEKLYMYLGDVGSLLNMKQTLAIMMNLIWGLAIITQILHHYYHWRGRQPNYLGVFNMMSGMITPYSIGLTDEKTVRRLVRRTKIVVIMSKMMISGISLISIIFCFVGYYLKYKSKYFIILGKSTNNVIFIKVFLHEFAY